MNVVKKTIDLGDGRTITIETGKLAKQADGAVEVRMGNTMLLATVCSAKEAGEGVDFMPLQVEYKTDTVLDVLQRVKQPGTYVLSLSADTLGAIKEVRGFVYYPIQSLPRTLTIDRVSLMRFHATDSLYTEVAVDSVQASSSTVAPKVQKEKTVVKPAIPARRWKCFSHSSGRRTP